MSSYHAPSSAMTHTLLELAQGVPALKALHPYADLDAALVTQVIDEAGKFVTDHIAPLNRVGDTVGVRWDQGVVTTPPGFKEAYQAFWQAGWPALAADPEHGGQGLPMVLEFMLYEMLWAANHGWTMAPGLLHGGYDCLAHHGSAELKARYLEKIASGEWLVTMCLTEPDAGSDLGRISTKAAPLPDGRYALSGTKIFISGGEHDLTENIVHLVLARLQIPGQDTPPGPKGLTLFLVPKFYPDGSRSAVVCERIEEKMGLHGSPTCVMRFDQAAAWMVGEPNKGLAAMFIMMNAARLHVALQGIGILGAAHQKALAYAQERKQMRSPTRGADTPSAADPIILHPAIERTLRTQAAWVELGRLIAYRTAIELDTAKHHADAVTRQDAERWCALCTPVLKAAWTEQAFVGASACLQVFGGHGYVKEWGIEQLVRDVRVAMIYEGTNEIQAIDLLIRKTLSDKGAGLQALFARLKQELLALSGCDPRSIAAIDEVKSWILDTVVPYAQANMASAETGPHWVAEDVLRATALALMAWANGLRGARSPDADHAAFWRWVWPELAQRKAVFAAMAAQPG